VLPSNAISTRSIDLVTSPPAASAPRICQAALPALMHVISAPTSPSAKLPSLSISPYIYPSTSDPISVQHVDESSPTNTICAITNALTTPGESRSSNVNIATSDPIDNRTWPAIPSSCTTAQGWMRKSPATCQNQSPGGLLSLFLRHTRLSHTLRTRTFNLAVG
jgi:hypothetical protein